MASKSQAKTESPSHSTSFLPLRMQSRRGSNGSLPPVSKLDKESLNHALDQIHSVASQSTALTMFNDFAPPPSSSSGVEPKGITSELQGGISGLYSRFRASVGGPKEITNAATISRDRGSVADDASSMKSFSQKSGGLPSPSANKLTFKSPKAESPAASISNLKLDGELFKRQNMASGAQSALANQTDGIDQTLKLAAKNSREAVEKYGTRLSLSEVLADDNREVVQSQHLEADDALEDLQRQLTVSPRTAVPPSSGDTFGKERPWIMTPEGHLSATLQSQPREREIGSFGSNGVKTLANGLEASHSARERASAPNPHDERLVFADKSVESRLAITRGQPNAQVTAQLHDPQKGPPTAQIPGINFSRASSYETGGASSVNTTMDVKSGSEKYSDHDKHPVVTMTAPKSVATVQTSADNRAVNGVLSQTRTRVLSKEYWMRDENARDCFNCGDAFSTFRRKHHCSEPNLRPCLSC